ncbi:MAG: hypothetical protein R3221_03985 [Spongiibacter sp.]|nr:hypothetical protein [Spongiibacter sp.]
MPELDLHTVLWAVAAAVVALNLIFLLRLRRRPGSSLLLLVVLTPLSGGLLLVSHDMMAYRNLAEEDKIGAIYIVENSPREFTLRIEHPDGEVAQYRVHGDQWRLEARVIRWDKAIASTGVKNLVKLQRVSGRYADLGRQAVSAATEHNIHRDEVVDTWQWLRQGDLIWRWVDVDFGSGVFAPLVDGAAYGIYLGRSGMFIQPENPIAIQALRDWSA